MTLNCESLIRHRTLIRVKNSASYQDLNPTFKENMAFSRVFNRSQYRSTRYLCYSFRKCHHIDATCQILYKMSKEKTSKSSNASRTNFALDGEGIDEKSRGSKQEPTKDIHAIEIILDVIENVGALHQVSFVHIKSEYDGRVVDVSEKTLILDEKVKLNWSFYIDIDTLVESDLDDLVSKPITFTVYQTQGEFDSELFKQTQVFEEIGTDLDATFDSAVSVYEAFTGEIVEDKELLKENKKKKKKLETPEISNEKLATKEDSSTKSKEKTKKKSEKSSTKPKKTDDSVSASKVSQKSTEDISVIIGIGTMDMLPLVLGNQTFTASVDLKPPISFDDDRMITYKNIPKMCVTVLIDHPIVFPMKPTILSITVESIFNIPQVITPEMECRICVWLPLTDNFQKKIILGNSVHKVEDVEYQMKAWPNVPVIGDNVNTTKYRIRRDFDNVRFASKKCIPSLIKRDNPKIVYNYIRRNILTSHNKTILHNYLLRYREIILEIFIADPDSLPALNGDKKSDISNVKMGQPGDTKKKMRPTGFLHLMALVDVSSLIYPGVTSTRVACQLSTYHEKEAAKATGVQDSYFIPKHKSVENIRQPVSDRALKKVESEKGMKKKNEASTASTSTKKGGKKNESRAEENLKNTLPSPPIPEEEEEPSMKIFNENGDPTIIIVEMDIAEPLVEARPAEDLMVSLTEMIPVKPTLPKTALSIKIVEENYKNVIQEISMNLNEHLTKYLQEKKQCQCTSQADFLTYLRRLGFYQKYILTLRKAISVLINKKYDSMDFALRRNNKKHQDLIGKFFVYLVSQMNTILNKQNCSVAGYYKEGPLSSMNSTLLYAKEACELKQYTAAEKYYMERLCLEEDNPDVWFDYALFQLEMDSPELAFEYLNEALSRKLDHTNSLLLYGILLTEKGKMSDAETCFMTVLVHRPRWVEGWGVLFLFYHKNHNAGGMAFAEDMAKQYLNDERTEQDYFMKSDDLVWTAAILPRTIFFKTAVILLKLRMYFWVEDALSFEIASHPGKVNYLLAAICFFQENYDHALDHLHEAKLIEGWNYAVVAMTGHCYVWKGQYKEAREQFYYVLDSFDRPDDMHLLYVHCARVLSLLGKEQEARKIMLKACKNNPTPHTWTIAGTFFYNENDLLSAEECFTEANICNNRIPEVWAFLTLINLKLDRETEAELCYQQALKNELEDTKLIAAITDEIANFQKRNYDIQAQFSISPNLN